MKKISKHLRAKVLLSLALCFCNTMISYALPSQGTLNNTAATINVNNSQMTISGKGHNNIINWATFDVATGETVNFNDKNNYLNLVHGIDMSRIYGTISGGNIVYLVNPNGILFGQGAKLDNIGSFIASTRNISSINQTEFLNNPANTEGVLGSNINGMDNKTYYPSQSKYVPKITVAETQLTNVPNSVNTIILDGPGGVILKNTAALDQVAKIYTKKNGGEIGIGTASGNIALTQAQKDKIKLINGSVTEAYQDNANVLNKYTAIQSIEDLKNVSSSNTSTKKNMMLWNDIDASNVTNYNPINTQGTFEGMGYRISGLEIVDKPNSSEYMGHAGVFGEFSGNIRNLSVDDIHFKGLSGYNNIGGVVGHLQGGILSNVFVSGEIKGTIDWNRKVNIGGLVGIDDTRDTYSEIRNSGSSAIIDLKGDFDLDSRPFSVGGIIGKQSNKGGLYNVYNTGNINVFVQQQRVNLGGIVGSVSGSSKFDVLGATNVGSLSSKHGNVMWTQQNVNLGGIVGAVENSKVSIGDTSNFGNIYEELGYKRYNDPNQILLYTGGILGRSYGSDTASDINNISVDNKPLSNLYVANNGNARYNTNFGESKTLSEMSGLYDNNMRGIYNIEGIGNGAYSVYVVPGGNGSSTTGGNTGGNSSGSTIIYTGGNNSGSTGGNAGGSNSGSVNGGISYYAGSYEGTTSETEMILLENGVIPQGYKGDTIVVVMDPNNSENSKAYIQRNPTDTQPVVVNDNNENNNNATGVTWWGTLIETLSPENIASLIQYMWFNNDKKNEPSNNFNTLAGNLSELAKSPNYLYEKKEVSKNISRQGTNGDDIPQEVFDKYAEAVSDSLKISSSLGTPTASTNNMISLAVKTTEGIPRMDNLKVNGIEYHIDCGEGVQSGSTTARIWWNDKNGKLKEGELKWTGSEDTKSFFNAVESIGKDSLENVFDALINDSTSVLKVFVANSDAESLKQLRNTFGNKVTKTVLEQIIKGIGGADILKKAAEISLDAL